MKLLGNDSLRLLALMLCISLLFTSAVMAEDEELVPFGLALDVKGEVFLTRDIIEFETKIEENLFYGDEIETGEDGFIIISFGSSFMSVGPNTNFVLARNRTKSGKEIITVELEEGRFRSKILGLRKNQTFQVESERGTVTVYGTDLVTGITPGEDDEQGLKVSVLKGKVGMRAKVESGKRPKPVLIRRNESSSLDTKGESKGVNSMSSTVVANIKKALPLPGDDDEEPLTFAKKRRKAPDKEKEGKAVAQGQPGTAGEKENEAGEKEGVKVATSTSGTGTGTSDDPETASGTGETAEDGETGSVAGEDDGPGNEVAEDDGTGTDGTGEEISSGDTETASDDTGSETGVGGDTTVVSGGDDTTNPFEPETVDNDFITGGGGGGDDIATEDDPFADLGGDDLADDTTTGDDTVDDITNPFEEQGDTGFDDPVVTDTDDVVSDTFTDLADTNGTDEDTVITTGGDTITDSTGVNDEIANEAATELNIIFTIESGK